MAKKKAPVSRNPLRWLWRQKTKLLLVFATLLGAYAFYLDAQLKIHFSGNKWQVPAQIYARPLTLQLKQEIAMREITDELALLGYRKVAKARHTGEYQLKGNQVRIMRRAFHFADGFAPERGVTITLKDGRVQHIKATKGRKAYKSFRLEPWLVTRLVSSGKEDRMLVDINEVPELLLHALILVEDRDFYEHHGVAPLAIARALVANISAGRAVQGGSTLTQQLVKNLYLTREKSLVRKAKEALMSLVIEARYSKEEILEAYLNEVFLGQNGGTGVHGFGLASYFYFDRPLAELQAAEIATLVGMVKGPSYYNPRRHAERALTRRNLVLRLLFEDGALNRNEYEQTINQPVRVASGASLAQGKHPAFMDKVQRELRGVLADPGTRQSGIKVFSTLDVNAQRRAEKALATNLNHLERKRDIEALQGALVVTDVDSGEIRAMVGDKKPDFKGFNRALDARRSVGSLVKPAIFLTALEQAGSYHLASPLQDKPIQMKSDRGSIWQPQNADKKFRGQVPLITALSRSLNVPTVSLGMELGLPTVIESLQRLGVTEPIRAYPALTLGALELSPLQVNQMYQTIANNGEYIPLHAVNAVLSSDNRVLWQREVLPEQRFDDKATYLLNYALHKVTRDGTAKAIKSRFPGVNMAGKTGTTDDYRDSWFSGFDKQMLITSWIGKDDNEVTGLSGASGAMQVFMDYQASQSPKSLVRRFPEGLGIAHFHQDTGVMLKAGCDNTMSVPAILASLPEEGQDCAERVKPPPKKKSWWERLWSS